ncbi:MAG: uroporphyrinogen-III C-methyltransferase [Methylococcales bacterium]|jgi:uroporphyrin-III C-methyltransferase/precorrin-2 dehydrogenase/sirohydrochlorin ferrochelatase|nr:uroporphyrinogen-III C-methyltransferase [Methylococcales bacterium]
MDFLPIFLDVKHKRCLLVGAGDIALRKATLLNKAQADILVVSPDITSEFQTFLDANTQVTLLQNTFKPEHLEGCHLVIAATNQPQVNRQVSSLARAQQIPVNVVDSPEECSFIVPSILDRSPIVAAVSSGGTSPVLARSIRANLETLIPAAYGTLANIAHEFRNSVKTRFENTTLRMRFWENIFHGPVSEMVFSGQLDRARTEIQKQIDSDAKPETEGEVYLVGSGPGDPDLLTFRAIRLMQKADVVVYDRLVSQPILDLTRKDAKRIYVGKERDNHAVPQDEINELLAKLAIEGHRVLRLKGGDPFIFGRGGEEIELLAEKNVPFQVVPGITAASGCSTYSGIPLTHRDYAQSCVFVTGHLKDGSTNLNWELLTQPNQTVVFYMGLKGLNIICEQLVKHGLPSTLPAALVQQGTTPDQRVFTGTLETLPGIVEREKPKAPTLIIVGSVVELREKLAWFDKEDM